MADYVGREPFDAVVNRRFQEVRAGEYAPEVVALNADGTAIGAGGGGGAATIADGADVAQGTTTDAEVAAGNGTIVAILKRLRSLLAGGLPAALGAQGALKVEGVASGTAQPVDTELPAAALLADNTAMPTTPTVGAMAMIRRVATNTLYTWSGALAGDGNTDIAGGMVAGYVLSLPFAVAGTNTADRLRTPKVFKVVDLAAGTAETTIWTPAAGKKFRFMGFLLTCEAASTLVFNDNTAGTAIFEARGGTDVPVSPAAMGNGILSAAANNVLTVTRGTSTALRGVVWGTEE